jgi:hypothetical protein
LSRVAAITRAVGSDAVISARDIPSHNEPDGRDATSPAMRFAQSGTLESFQLRWCAASFFSPTLTLERHGLVHRLALAVHQALHDGRHERRLELSERQAGEAALVG